jgi:hypothetical protein
LPSTLARRNMPRRLATIFLTLPSLGSNPAHRLQFGGSGLNDGSDLGSESPNRLLRRDGPMPLTKTPPRYRSIPSTVLVATVFMALALNCSPCSLSLTHQPSATSHSPAVTEGSDPMSVVSFRCPGVLTRRTRDTVLAVVKDEALDQPEDFLGRRAASRSCGIHQRASIFPRVLRACGAVIPVGQEVSRRG